MLVISFIIEPLQVSEEMSSAFPQESANGLPVEGRAQGTVGGSDVSVAKAH